MTEEFENQPATKRDLAEVKEELVDTMVTKDEFNAGIERILDILRGPNGHTERLDRLEQRVGGYR